MLHREVNITSRDVLREQDILLPYTKNQIEIGHGMDFDEKPQVDTILENADI
jgi:hypothetical protein